MDLNKLFRNPEARKVTSVFLFILIMGASLISFGCYKVSENINNTLINQNIVILSNIIEDKSIENIVRNFYRQGSKENVEKAKEILNTCGYDRNINFSSNEIVSGIFKDMLYIFIPIIIIFIFVSYLFFINILKGIYKKIENVSNNTNAMSSGEYKKIDGEYGEGEIAILVSSLNFMGDRVNNSIKLLKKEKENLKDFLSDISHQLKTPLSSLVMFNDLLRENSDMPYEDRINFLDRSQEQLSRMEWLIMNLLKVGRIEANAIKFEMESSPIIETLELALSPLKPKAEEKRQNLTLKCLYEINVVHDKEWLAEALSNIIKNSIEHTDEGGNIDIEVVDGPLITKIYIKDNGEGIPSDMQKKVFKRFYKGEHSKEPKSIGIGLSLSKSIIEELGGEIKLISEVGNGTTFIISFIKDNNIYIEQK